MQQSPQDAFLAQVDAFLARSGMAAWRLGRDAIGDPNFVGDLRAGRSPSLRLVARVTGFMSSHSAPEGVA